jgi:hypothetical protein
MLDTGQPDLAGQRVNNFAVNNVTSADGRKNKQKVPDEIVAYGFKPPVQTPDGSWQAGDELPANWLNWLLNDLYKGAVTADLTSQGTLPSNAVAGSYRAIQIGNILFQQINITATAAQTTLTYPIPFATGSSPLVGALDVAARTGTASVVQAIYPTSGDPTKTIDLYAMTANAAVNPGEIQVWAIGTYDLTKNLSSAQTVADFCPNAMTYSDGQDNLYTPDALTIAQGFVPPYVNSGAWVEGDALPAPLLNFLLQDLYKTPALLNTHPGVTTQVGCLDLGGICVQWAIIAGGATASARWTYERPYTVAPSVIVLDAAAAVQANFGYLAQLTNTYADVAVANSGAICQNAASIMVMAIGATAATVSSTTSLPNFAGTNYTYPDGQANKVKPSNTVVSNGYLFETANAQGDQLTANELNWLLNDLYAGLGFEALYSKVTHAGDNTARDYYVFRLGKMLIQGGRLSTASFNADGQTFTFPRPFAAAPAISMSYMRGAAANAVGSASGATYISAGSITATGAQIAERTATGSVNTGTREFGWVAIGLAP